MYIALTLKKILSERDEARKLTGMPLKALCQMDDNMSVSDHIWLSDSGLKTEFVSFVKTGNPVLDNGLIAGSLSALPTDGILITSDETLLSTGKVTNGKYSLSFAGSIKDALDAYKKTGKKPGPGRRRKDAAMQIPAKTQVDIAPEKEDEPVEEDDVKETFPMPAPTDVDDAKTEEVPQDKDMKAMDDVQDTEISMPEEVPQDAPEDDEPAQNEAANEFAEITYDQTDRTNAREYPDDFEKGIEGRAYEEFKKRTTEYGVKNAMVPYVLTTFQLSVNEEAFYYRLNEVVSDTGEANEIYFCLGEHFDELKKLADKVEPIDAYI